MQSRLAARPISIVVATGFMTICLLCLAIGFAVQELRIRDINQAKRELMTLDVLLAEETERAIESIDLVLKSVQQRFAQNGLGTAEDFVLKQGGLETHEFLKTQIAGIPQLDALSLIAADGHVVNFSRFYPVPDIQTADRDYFLALRDHPTEVPFVSEPVRNRGTGTWTMYIARRVSGPSGEFLGLVIGAIDLGYFENLYKSLQIGSGGAVSLWRRDGILLARFPSLPGVGHVFRIQSFTGILRAGSPVTYEVENSIDGPPRIVATIAAKKLPLVINVTQTFESVLAAWRQVATLAFLGGLLCIVAISLVVWLLMRQFATYEKLGIAVAERRSAIAEREAAEAQLRQAQKLEAVGQLTGGIAHDFNNLLTAVLGSLELLNRNLPDTDPRHRRWAINAYEAAQRGAVMTQRLLAFSRRQPLDPQPADIAILVMNIADILRRTLGENIYVETNVAVGLWSAFVDWNQLDNAILNIAINARDAMDGRGQLLIEAENKLWEEENPIGHSDVICGQYILISICDTGKGIEKEVIERVFEPFFTTKPVGQGTGLGLSQVYGFVKQTGGHIEIESEAGKGTKVRMYLPRAKGEPRGPQRSKAEEEIQEASKNITILVVEDDDAVRAYSIEILREFGYTVCDAPNADSACEILRKDAEINLLFTDVGLPGTNGRGLADEALRLRPDLKVLFTSGYPRDAIVHCGGDAQLISKPFGRSELARKIKAILEPQQRSQSAVID
jgi:signal transduction histidine kinase